MTSTPIRPETRKKLEALLSKMVEQEKARPSPVGPYDDLFFDGLPKEADLPSSAEFLLEETDPTPTPKVLYQGMPNNHRSCQSHCCIHHGCKYGYEDCPVVTQQVFQDFPCEDCPPAIEWTSEANSVETGTIAGFPIKLTYLGDTAQVSFLGRTSEFHSKNAQISALIFASDVAQEIHNALHPYHGY